MWRKVASQDFVNNFVCLIRTRRSALNCKLFFTRLSLEAELKLKCRIRSGTVTSHHSTDKLLDLTTSYQAEVRSLIIKTAFLENRSEIEMNKLKLQQIWPYPESRV